MKSIFRDPSFHRRVETDGYLALDVFTDEDLIRVGRVHDEFVAATRSDVTVTGFHISLDVAAHGLARRASEALLAIVAPRLAEVFVDHRLFAASFVIKESGDESIVHPHQDWTVVDESEFWSATLWTPLVDVSSTNGAIGVIPGSHRAFDGIRASPNPAFLSALAEHAGDLIASLELLPSPRGRSILWDNRTLHGSPPNTSGRTRVAFGIGITHREARLVHHHLLAGSDPVSVVEYEVDEDFFLDHGNARLAASYAAGEGPSGLVERARRPHRPERLDRAAVHARLAETRRPGPGTMPRFVPHASEGVRRSKMKQTDVLETYDTDYAERYDETFLASDPHSKEKLRCELEMLSALLDERGAATRWADVACGTGHVLGRFPHVARTGVDLSPAMLAVARRRLPDVPLVEGDFRDPSLLPERSVDVVSSMWWAYSLVDSISDVEALVDNLSRWLRDDGVCFMPIGDPSRNLYGGVHAVPSVAAEEAPVYGGRIRVTSVTWSWIEADGKRHDNMVLPQVDYMVDLFRARFATVDVVPYFHAYRAIVARKRAP